MNRKRAVLTVVLQVTSITIGIVNIKVSQETCVSFERLFFKSHESSFQSFQIYEQSRLQHKVWHRVRVNLTSSY